MVKVNNRDGNVSRKIRFIPCSKRNADATTRAENENCKYEITVGFIIAWTGVIILHGAISDSSKSIWQYYIDVPYGISYPPIKNSMTRDAFEFMRRYFHPSNPTRLPKKRGESGYDALIKVRWIGKTIPVMKGLRNAWVAGMRITIDESMVNYNGKSVGFVQYLPAKPIKHGIKIFSVCCSYSAFLL